MNKVILKGTAPWKRTQELPTCCGDHLLHKDSRTLQVVDWEVHSWICAGGRAYTTSQWDMPWHHGDWGGLYRTNTGHWLLITLQCWLPRREREAH